jgi:hypothetical protein
MKTGLRYDFFYSTFGDAVIAAAWHGHNERRNMERGGCVLGMIMNQQELKEFEYLLKKEMEEIIFDLTDERIDKIVKSALEDRYQVMFNLFRRIAAPADCRKYLRRKIYNL